ncbi:MAG: oligosaccharide flippase family protein [Candidatus Heteroscillospira sp.]|jgi:O-antigen/teichoic acid export membrane protein
MDRKNALVFNTALLTAVSLIMRCIGMVWQVWLVSRIGSAGIGLFTLVLSVGSLAATFAISGIRYTSTRLISEELGRGNSGGVTASVARCCAYALFFGISAMLILFLTAERIGFLWIGDARTVLSLEILSFSLPFASLSSVLSGYFTSIGRVYKSAAAQLLEQLGQVVLTVVFLKFAPHGDLEKCCAAVVAAGTLAQMLSFCLLELLYIFDRRQYRLGKRGAHITNRMLRIAMPLALSAYARTSLSTLQQMLVPRGLRRAGLSADRAMSDYGIIQGMAFPVVSFPACFLMALGDLLVPELTEAQVAGREKHIARLTTSLLERCLIFSLGVSALLFTFSHELGLTVYSSDTAGHYIGMLALLAPVMYMDMLTDACLKGLGQMLYSMSVNVLDSVVCVVMVLTLLPRMGLQGYILVIFVSELLNFLLSILRLQSMLKLRLRPGTMLTALLCAVGSAQGARLLLNFAGVRHPAAPGLTAALVCAGALYILLLKLCVEKEA